MGVHATAVYSQVLLRQNLLVTVQILESWDQVLSELIRYIKLNEYLLLLMN